MDLSIFQFEDTATMPVRSPVDGSPLVGADGTPVTITLCGRDSALYRKVTDDEIRNRIQGGATEENADARIMAKFTSAWCGIQYEGKDLPCDFEHAFSLYKRTPWLREQISVFVGERANFMKAS